MKIRNVLLLIFSAANALLAQDNAWQIKLADGDILSNLSLQNVVGDSLVVSQTGQARRIAVDDIVEMRRAGKSKFWKGAGIGFLAGGATGALIGLATYEEPDPANGFTLDFGPGANALAGGILGGLGGFVVGGMIGASAGKDEVYDFSTKTFEQKLAVLRLIVAK